MKDWEDIIKERQLSRKAELPESDWNDFLSRRAEHERAARHRRKVITLFISVPAAAAVLLFLFLMPFKTVAPDNQLAQNEPSEPQVLADSIVNTVDSIKIEEKPQLEIAQVKPQPKPEVKAQIKRESKQQSKQESKPEEKPEANPEIRTGAVEDVRLAEVSASAVVQKLEMVNDTVMFNGAAYGLPEGSQSVEEFVSRLPGVEIGSDGEITVNGKKISRILVNGKEFFDDEKTVALTELTAEMIEKVKAYEKKSDLSRQTGIDDGREATVLDLPARGKIIKGSVWDFDTAEPLENASVQIYRVTRRDTTLMCGTMTGNDGSFVIYNLKRGKYVARVSLKDYKTVNGRFKIGSGSGTYDIGKIAIRRTDMMIYDNRIPENYTPTVPIPTDSASMMELILKLPGVEMDSAGVINVNGKTVRRVIKMR